MCDCAEPGKPQYDDELLQLMSIVRKARLTKDVTSRWMKYNNPERFKAQPDPVKSEGEEPQQTSARMLPWWCVFIPWSLVVCLTVTCAVLTILYTFTFGADKSLAWLRSFIFALMGEIFIDQPLTVLGVALFFAFIVKRSDMESVDVTVNRESDVNSDDMEAMVAERVAVKLLRLNPVYYPPYTVSTQCCNL